MNQGGRKARDIDDSIGRASRSGFELALESFIRREFVLGDIFPIKTRRTI